MTKFALIFFPFEVLFLTVIGSVFFGYGFIDSLYNVATNYSHVIFGCYLLRVVVLTVNHFNSNKKQQN